MNLKFLPYLCFEAFFLALKLACKSSIEMLLMAVMNSFSSFLSSALGLAALASDSYLKAEELPDFKLDLRMDFWQDKCSGSGASSTFFWNLG